MDREKNYFILGLGLGIIIVNIIYYFNPRLEPRELTDQEIISRAEELGMVNIKDRIEEDKKDKLVNKEDKEERPDIEEQETLEETEGPDDKVVSDIEIIEIKKGDNLTDTAEELFNKGLIKDREEFKKIINEKDLSKRIHYGSYEIEKGSSYEEIIDKIVK